MPMLGKLQFEDPATKLKFRLWESLKKENKSLILPVINQELNSQNTPLFISEPTGVLMPQAYLGMTTRLWWQM